LRAAAGADGKMVTWLTQFGDTITVNFAEYKKQHMEVGDFKRRWGIGLPGSACKGNAMAGLCRLTVPSWGVCCSWCIRLLWRLRVQRLLTNPF
jgi:hypothetical protein